MIIFVKYISIFLLGTKMGKQTNVKSTATSSSEFMAQNWWILWVVIGLFGMYMFFVLANIEDKYNAVLKKFDESSKGVVMLDYSGRAMYAEKTRLDALNQGFKNAIANALRFYAVKDWSTISHNYKNQVRTIEELEKSVGDIVEFKENYFSPNAPQGLADFDAYEKTLLYLLNNDSLPEKILPNETSIDQYKVNEDAFEIDLSINVLQNIYLLETDKWIDRTGVVKIKATGYFNPSKGTAINPLGITFTSFKPTYLKKR